MQLPNDTTSGLESPLSALQRDGILCGDALEVLRGLPSNSVDALVTDPPAGIAFMGKSWDTDKGGRDAWIAWLAAIMREALRVVKPGGHALVWALPRTSHWTGMALEDAGWDVRDKVAHWYSSGFPKSLDVSKAIDKAAGAQRERVRGVRSGVVANAYAHDAWSREYKDSVLSPEPITDAARAWDGWGTALKPAYEDWWLVRKPLAEGTVAANVLAHGTGALHIAACRVGNATGLQRPERRGKGVSGGWAGYSQEAGIYGTPDGTGRWPPNLLLSHAAECVEDGPCSLWCPVRALDEQSGTDKARPTTAGLAGRRRPLRNNGHPRAVYSGFVNDAVTTTYAYDDTGTAARFFPTFKYVAKASRAERNRGCEALEAKRKGSNYGMDGARPHTKPDYHYEASVQNSHPTVKPLALMSWLITLITPPGGLVLDPFAGSGSTLCAAKAGGWRYLGIERETEYVAICEARLAATPAPSLGSAEMRAQPKPTQTAKKKPRATKAKPTPPAPLWDAQEFSA